MREATAMKRAGYSLGRERRMDLLICRTDVQSVRFVPDTDRFVVMFEQERDNN